MPKDEILELLIAERNRIDGAIKALQGGGGAIPSPFKGKAPKAGKRTLSPEARAKMAAAAKARWAKKKGSK